MLFISKIINIKPNRIITNSFLIILLLVFSVSCNKKEIEEVHVYEIYVINLIAQTDNENPYKNILCWVQLKGPDFNKRVYAFWDGGKSFKIRVVSSVEASS